eukprot:scaffold112431_cov33-Phaeocystis_antarctica.AAC.1
MHVLLYCNRKNSPSLRGLYLLFVFNINTVPWGGKNVSCLVLHGAPTVLQAETSRRAECRDLVRGASRPPQLIADPRSSHLPPRTAELWRCGASRTSGKRRLALHTAENLPAGQKRQGRGLGECGWLCGRG